MEPIEDPNQANTKDQEASQGEVQQEGLLYKLLNVTKNATLPEIRKSYKILARKWHPDKNQDDPDAKDKFQKLSEAYQILSDPAKRRVYDTTGEIDGEGVRDISKFIDAYLYYRNKYREVSSTDIKEYQKIYVGGEDEEEDLIDFFELNEGDVTLVLEAIPYSSNKDKKRFVKFFTQKLKEGVLSPEFEPTFKKTKRRIKGYKVELDEEEAGKMMEDLANQIQANMKSRGNDMMANMMAKYGGGAMNMLEYENEPPFDLAAGPKTKKKLKVGKKKKGAGRGRKGLKGRKKNGVNRSNRV